MPVRAFGSTQTYPWRVGKQKNKKEDAPNMNTWAAVILGFMSLMVIIGFIFVWVQPNIVSIILLYVLMIFTIVMLWLQVAGVIDMSQLK